MCAIYLDTLPEVEIVESEFDDAIVRVRSEGVDICTPLHVHRAFIERELFRLNQWDREQRAKLAAAGMGEPEAVAH